MKRPQTAGVSQVALKSSSSKKQEDDGWGAPAAATSVPSRASKVVNEWDDADELLENLGGGVQNVPKRNNNADLFNNEGTRGSQGSNKGEYSGFGILGKSRQQQYPTFGNKRNSAGASGGDNEEDDLLDNILDNFEEKKGIESTKPKSIQNNSFGSQAAQSQGGFNRLQSAKSQVINDPWNRDHLDDLEDVGGNNNPADDVRSKKSGAS
jgi:hypothetical protein